MTDRPTGSSLLRGSRLPGELVEQMRTGLDPTMEVGQAELLVGPVQIIVVLAPAQE